MAATWKKLAFEDDVILKSVINAQGDLIVGDADDTPAILSVGTDTYVLTADADAANGLGVDWLAQTPAAHKDTHDPEDGSDQLDTAAPAELAGVQASGEGSSHSFARADHAHQIQESMADDHLVTINQADVASADIAVFTATGGLGGSTPAEVAATMKLDDIGVPDAAVDFSGEQAHDVVLDTYANFAALPNNDQVGQIAWATDPGAAYLLTAYAA